MTRRCSRGSALDPSGQGCIRRGCSGQNSLSTETARWLDAWSCAARARWLARLDRCRCDVVLDAAALSPGGDVFAALGLHLDAEIDEAGRPQPVIERAGGRGTGDAAAQQRLVRRKLRRQRADI